MQCLCYAVQNLTQNMAENLTRLMPFLLLHSNTRDEGGGLLDHGRGINNTLTPSLNTRHGRVDLNEAETLHCDTHFKSMSLYFLHSKLCHCSAQKVDGDDTSVVGFFARLHVENGRRLKG